ncbi:MAG: UDP-N-acetylmuramate dehydrogenase [Patescibacteria group bacterium]
MLEIKENEPLKNHTSFRIGGPARYFVAVKTTGEIQEAIDWASARRIEYKVIGGGSNLLVADSGFGGLVIKYFGGDIRINGSEVEVSAGIPLVLTMNQSLQAGLAGLEWAIGIPGTIGGAICNNAGAYGGEMSQNIASVTLLTDGVIKELEQIDCRFGYRESAFKSGAISGVILLAKLKLKKADSAELAAIKDQMAKNLADRLSKSAEGGSAGSTFRNITLSEAEIKKFKEKFPQLPDRFVDYRKIPAAWLIDECGLKGKKIGQAMVSERQAGKITNLGGATAENVIMLISLVKQKVRHQFGVQLMEEIEYLGF